MAPDRRLNDLVSINLKFALTADEFLAGQRIYNRHIASAWNRYVYRLLVPAGILFIVVGAAGFAIGFPMGLSILIFTWGAFLITERTIFWLRKMRKEFTQYPPGAWDQIMELDDDKVLVQSTVAKAEISWERFSRFAENDKIFFLYTPPRAFYPIPKRVLSPEDTDRLRELLQRKLPEKGRIERRR